MTATLPPAQQAAHVGPRVRAGDGDQRGTTRRGRGSAVTTLLSAAGSALAMMPLAAVFLDWTWLFEAWLALGLVAAVLAVLRVERTATIAEDVVGLAALAGFLVVVHLSQHAVGGVIPTPTTMHDLTAVLDRASDLIRDSRPPVESTPSLRLISTASLVASAIVIDVIAVVLRASATAGLVILALVTAGTSIAREPIGVMPFIVATAGYVLILAAGAARERREWIEAAPVHGSQKGAAAAHGATAARVATLAMVVALIAPIFTPIAANTRLNGLFSRGGEGGVALSPFAKLQGSLNQTSATPLFKVTMNASGPTEPYYLRDIVLDTYSSQQGWTTSDTGKRGALDDQLRQDPPAGPLTGTAMSATVNVLDLSDSSAPTFATLTDVSGLGSSWRWNTTTATVSGGVTRSGSSYQLSWVQPAPTAEQLRAAPQTSDHDLQRWLKLPDDVPAPVLDQARTLVAGKATPFDEALAIQQFFILPTNGFAYSTTTSTADTGDGLTDFLLNRRGFCQQYAGAMAVMARQVGLPARIVLGYTHESPDQSASFTVTSHDAHAWVEIYFDGLGWVPFDPTPLTGADADRAVPLTYAPGNGTIQTPDDPNGPTGATVSTAPQLPQDLVPDEVLPDSGPLHRPDQTTSSRPLEVLLALGAVLIILLAPAAARMAQRRRRIGLARRTGALWPWWQEFQSTAEDLGVTWPRSATLREVPAAVLAAMRARSESTADATPLIRLTRAAERERFGPASAGADARTGQAGSSPDLAIGATAVRDLRRAMGTRARIRAWWLPASILRPAARQLGRALQAIAASPAMAVRKLRRTGP